MNLHISPIFYHSFFIPINQSIIHNISTLKLKQSSPMKMAETATEVDKMAALATAANEARGLAMDSIAAAHSGHMGLPLGCAEIGAALYGSQVSYIILISNEI